MQIKNRQQTLVIVAIVAVGLFAGDKLVFDPLLDGWNARSKRIESLRRDVVQGKALLDRKDDITRHWDWMQRNTLPINPPVAEQQFWQALDRWRQNSGVIISGTTPQWKSDSEEYITYQCRLDASGSLSALSKFLYNIEAEPMALRIESMELSARDKTGQQLALGLQVSGLVLTPKIR